MSQFLKKVTAARTLAPEDVRPGVYVAVMREISEHACAIEWRDEFMSGEKSVRYRCVEIPESSENGPLLVEAVCTPFVLARDAQGKSRTLDLRRLTLARLRRSYGEFAFARLKAESSSA